MLKEKEIIHGCRKHDRIAQKTLYEKYSPVMRGLCFRYCRESSEVEDILQEGFIKIFSKIKQYSGRGSFEGWLKRIMINTAITHYKKNQKHYYHDDVTEIHETIVHEDLSNELEEDSTNVKDILLNADFSQDEILKVIQNLPEGYGIVFNLFAVESYKHKEIAKLLNISVNTSKSQLSRARKMIQRRLYETVKDKTKKTENKGDKTALLLIIL
jgi:RNA polymerase sigma-70 factor (ECF subfamily)